MIETGLGSQSRSRRSETKDSTVRGPKATPKRDRDWKDRDKRCPSKVSTELAGFVRGVGTCGCRRYAFRPRPASLDVRPRTSPPLLKDPSSKCGVVASPRCGAVLES